MTAMPQMVALFNGVGGGAVALIAWVEYRHAFAHGGLGPWPQRVMIFELFGSDRGFHLVLGLGGRVRQAPGDPPGLSNQAARTGAAGAGNLVLLVIALGLRRWRSARAPIRRLLFIVGIPGRGRGCSVLMLVLPIGGADMPVVISLLNAFTGLSAAATGVALSEPGDDRRRDDRRRLGHDPDRPDGQGDEPSVPATIAGGFGGAVAAPAPGAGFAGRGSDGPLHHRLPTSRSSWSYARQVVVAPGYGMAVAQAQHAVRELELRAGGQGRRGQRRDHRSAGRMPGHMNVLLAEADVPYDLLREMDDINPEFSRTDVDVGDRRQRRHQSGRQERARAARSTGCRFSRSIALRGR